MKDTPKLKSSCTFLLTAINNFKSWTILLQEGKFTILQHGLRYLSFEHARMLCYSINEICILVFARLSDFVACRNRFDSS